MWYTHVSKEIYGRWRRYVLGGVIATSAKPHLPIITWNYCVGYFGVDNNIFEKYNWCELDADYAGPKKLALFGGGLCVRQWTMIRWLNGNISIRQQYS